MSTTDQNTTSASMTQNCMLAADYDDFDRKAFSDALLTRRVVSMRIDVRQAAMQIGISAATLSRCENGKTPDVYSYYYCCKWLGVPMQTFFPKIAEPCGVLVGG